MLTRFFAGDLGAFLARFRKADGDGLFAARYPAALTAFAGAERAALSSAHGTSHRLTCSFTVPAARTGFSGCHVVLLLVRFSHIEKSLRDRAGLRPTEFKKKTIRTIEEERSSSQKDLMLMVSYGNSWWARQDLNLGPTDYESAAHFTNSRVLRYSVMVAGPNSNDSGTCEREARCEHVIKKAR